VTADISPASFRDPAGFVFVSDGVLLRQVNLCHKDDYDCLMQSGLYDELSQAGLLISHRERQIAAPDPDQAYKIIEPDRIRFISYPYEWCFSQLKSAALATLDIQRRALARGMSLKDCSHFNIQFVGLRPVLIDTLSIERYREGAPWSAYRQFCEHFLAPLALMSKVDVRMAHLMRDFIDGIPIDLASRLLPLHTRLNLPLLLHVHLHARAQTSYKAKRQGKVERKVSRIGLLGIVDSLQAAVSALKWQPRNRDWADYYANTSYSATSMAEKKAIVSRYLDQVSPATVWDIGSNRGDFSSIAGSKGAHVIAFDSDFATVERSYRDWSRTGEQKILPLVIDMANPSPAVGWANNERGAFLDRGPADTIMALAVAHHMVIAGGIPLRKIASLLSGLCRALIIEFVPKSDPQVRDMLSNRADVFADYSREGFLNAFGSHFKIVSEDPIPGSDRVLFLMLRS
jgi:ribosomal protein L11 methylase PrmA